MTTYHPLLKAQHRSILETLQSTEENWKKGHRKACKILLEELTHLLVKHHQDEIEFLFAKVRARHQMREGGPFCSYFFDFFMNNRPQSQVESRLTQLTGQKYTLPIPENLKSYFSEQSLFCIPLEEHLAAQALAQGLNEALARPGTQNDPWIAESLGVLQDLIQSNFQKEETCLWEAVRQIQDPQLQADLATDFDPDADDSVVWRAPCGGRN